MLPINEIVNKLFLDVEQEEEATYFESKQYFETVFIF